jgi:hypothetical protein
MLIRDDIAELLHAGVPQIYIARQLRVRPQTVQLTREALGLPAPHRYGSSPRYQSVEAAYWAHAACAGGGHLDWTGWRNSSGVPVVRHRGFQGSAYRVAFRIHHGRVPEGQVRNACGMPGCVAGGHLADRVMREAAR